MKVQSFYQTHKIVSYFNWMAHSGSFSISTDDETQIFLILIILIPKTNQWSGLFTRINDLVLFANDAVPFCCNLTKT